MIIVVELLTSEPWFSSQALATRAAARKWMDESIALHHCEVWADCSRSAWHKVVRAADALADRLMAASCEHPD